MRKRYSTILILLFVSGCAKFDETKEYARCRQAYPDNDIATDKCVDFATSEWAGKHAWLPRVVSKRDSMP